MSVADLPCLAITLDVAARTHRLVAQRAAQIREREPEARSLAISIATMLHKYPGYEIIVSGHTDNQPISTSEFESNWDLSSSRAIRFMDVLLSTKKLDPRLFSAIGYGEYRPVSDNSTNLGRSKNRRVEVSIIRKYTNN